MCVCVCACECLHEPLVYHMHVLVMTVPRPYFHSDFCLEEEIGPGEIGGLNRPHLLHQMVRHQSDCRIVDVIVTALTAD